MKKRGSTCVMIELSRASTALEWREKTILRDAASGFLSDLFFSLSLSLGVATARPNRAVADYQYEAENSRKEKGRERVENSERMTKSECARVRRRSSENRTGTRAGALFIINDIHALVNSRDFHSVR